MEREVRYCTTEDGVRIAYAVEGNGPPLLVIATFVESFSLDNLVPESPDAYRRVGLNHQLIFFDMRGIGLSERNPEDMSLAATQRDIDAVISAMGHKRFSIFASAMGGLRALDYAGRHPRMIDRLVLLSAFARVQDVFSLESVHGLVALARANWDLATRTIADLGARREVPELGLRLANLFKQSTTGEIAARFIEASGNLDLTPLLPKVKAQTLIIHAMNDPIYPIAVGQQMAAAIPGARLLPLQAAKDAFSVWLDDAVLETVRAFLDKTTEAKKPRKVTVVTRSAFRTVLFTDLVGHTEMMQRLGDERGRDVLRGHERITREVLKAHGGTEVKTMGDGFMASFGSVTKAVECAVALQKAIEEWNTGVGAHHDAPPRVRVGLNAGEPIEEDGDLFGATVILASRIAAKADGGEILVADTVRGLCSGKGFLFADRGEFVAKGFEEPVRVYEVSWRG